jgi:hypothetical protein
LEAQEQRQTPVKDKHFAVAIVIFCDLMPGSPVACYQRLERTFRVHLHEYRFKKFDEVGHKHAYTLRRKYWFFKETVTDMATLRICDPRPDIIVVDRICFVVLTSSTYSQ